MASARGAARKIPDTTGPEPNMARRVPIYLAFSGPGELSPKTSPLAIVGVSFGDLRGPARTYPSADRTPS
eukprot:2462480-Pyramimonas_sp.AAC.1